MGRVINKRTGGFAVLGATLGWIGLTLAEEPPPPPPPPTLAPEIALPLPTPTPTATEAPPPVAPPPPPSEEASKAPEQPEPTGTPAPEATQTVELAPTAPAEPAAPPPQEETRVAEEVVARHQKWIPYYQTVRPAWGFEFSATLSAFGGGNIEASQAGTQATAFQLQFEYQPPFLQSIGVISLGPGLAMYPVGAGGVITNSPASIWSAGAQVRYQARFFREQPIVPIGGFEADYLTYHFVDGNIGATAMNGPFFGAMILLNFLEPSAASEFYIDQGVSRSYLLAEYKSLTGGDGVVSISGGSFYFGLRLEF